MDVETSTEVDVVMTDASNFDDLSDDALFEVLNRLDDASLFQICSSTRRLDCLCDDQFWRSRLRQRGFNPEGLTRSPSNWKAFYFSTAHSFDIGTFYLNPGYNARNDFGLYGDKIDTQIARLFSPRNGWTELGSQVILTMPTAILDGIVDSICQELDQRVIQNSYSGRSLIRLATGYEKFDFLDAYTIRHSNGRIYLELYTNDNFIHATFAVDKILSTIKVDSKPGFKYYDPTTGAEISFEEAKNIIGQKGEVVLETMVDPYIYTVYSGRRKTAGS